MLRFVVQKTVQRVQVGLGGGHDDVAIGAAARVHLAVGSGHADGDLAQGVDAARDGLHRELGQIVVHLHDLVNGLVYGVDRAGAEIARGDDLVSGIAQRDGSRGLEREAAGDLHGLQRI